MERRSTMNTITIQTIKSFQTYLTEDEKSLATVQKYLRDVTAFYQWLNERELTKSAIIEYKEVLCQSYAPTSVNSILASLNSFFDFLDLPNLKVKSLKIQRQIFTARERELTKQEYQRLVTAAQKRKNERLCLLMQTVCATGIRISELKYITVQAVEKGSAEIRCKGKQRTIFLIPELRKTLKKYAKTKGIKSGPIFVTRNGVPLDRSNVWSDMKKLCKLAGVSEKKVFPHNLRHLFARTYYSIEKDIVRLADLLGHSSINTTRIYTVESGEIHYRQIQRLGLLMRC